LLKTPPKGGQVPSPGEKENMTETEQIAQRLQRALGQELTNQLDELMSQMISLIMKAEDENRIPPYLTFHLAPDGCKVIKEWEEGEREIKKIEPILIFDNTLPKPVVFVDSSTKI